MTESGNSAADGKIGPLSTEQLAELGKLTVPLIADALDRQGLRNQVMSIGLRPVAAARRICGPAFPVQAVARTALPDNPYEMELEATDAIPTGSIVAFNSGGVMDAGVWGELLTTRALSRGGVGAVIDGAVRDIEGIEKLDFPTFAAAIHPADSFGRAEVIGFGDPIVCGDVPVRLGDVIVADVDGIVVIPYEIAQRTMLEAEAKSSKEAEAQQMLEEGASVQETYERHHVL